MRNKTKRHNKHLKYSMKSTKRRRSTSSKKHLYYQKGCASKVRYGGTTACPVQGQNGCPIAPLSYSQMKGGQSANPWNSNYYVPGPFTGNAWGAHVSQWPGADGIGSGRNFLAHNNYLVDPQTMMKLRGGKRKSKKRLSKNKKRHLKGGAIVPSDFTNLIRDIKFNFNSSYNSLYAKPAPVNPQPYADQYNKNSLSSSIVV